MPIEGATTIKEGKTLLLVPTAALSNKVPPKTPAFFNPQAKLGRDLSIAVYRGLGRRVSRPMKVADALAGVGARGVRMAVEIPQVQEVFMNDLNPTATEYAKASAEMNKVVEKCSFSTLDACHFLIEHSGPGERFDIVEVDPFGSPAPYIDCAMRAIRDGGVISVTATDTAVLCGLYPNVAARRYFGTSLRTEYCNEVGLRLLIGALVHSAMRLDMGIKPLFSHSTRHYMRVYVRVSKGARFADEGRKGLGFLHHCFECGNRMVSSSYTANCDMCKSNFKLAGPLWASLLYDQAFLSDALSMGMEDYFDAGKIIKRALDELATPTYFVPDVIADSLGVITPSLSFVMENLRVRGYKVSRTALSPKGVRTDAPSHIVREVVKGLSGQVS